MMGRVFTAEHKAKIGAKSKGRQTMVGTRWIHLGMECKILLPGHRMPTGWEYGRPGLKIAALGNQFGKALLGRTRSEEHKQHISEALKGNINLANSKQGLRKITNGKVAIMLNPNQAMPEGFNYTKGQPLQ
jgi:hypothetical protein